MNISTRFLLCLAIAHGVLSPLADAGRAVSERELRNAVAQLSSSSAGRRQEAQETLVAGGTLAGEMIVKGLERGSSAYRRRAVPVLAKIAGEDAEIALAELALADRSEDVRQTAIEGLRSADLPFARKHVLRQTMADGPVKVRDRALETVCAIGDKRYIDELVRWLDQEGILKRPATTGLKIDMAHRQFQGYDNFSTEIPVETGSGTRTVTNKQLLPVSRSVRISTEVVVSTGRILAVLTGRDFGDDSAKWKEWWEEQREDYRFPKLRR